MDSVLLESPTAEPYGLQFPFRPNYDALVKESTERFISGVQKGTCDFSGFRSIFSRLIHSDADPPLEIIWFHSAVSYFESLSSEQDVISRVLAVKHLMRLIVACSASCGAEKSAALLAPVVSELCHVISEVEGSLAQTPGKEMKMRLRREVESLVEGILGYISICGGKRSAEESGISAELLPCFVDVVQIWTFQRKETGNEIRQFFPFGTDEVVDVFTGDKCTVDYLAGVVAVEAFLLRLYLKIKWSDASLKPDLQNELRVWAVSSITGFGSCEFFDMLLRLMLASPLPSITLLKVEDEGLLRKILYDALLLVEYSFLYPTEGKELCESLRSISLRRLVLAHEAIQATRTGDHGKTISYINACSQSALLSGFVKSITNQFGMSGVNKPSAATPEIVLKWLLTLEQQGLNILGHNIVKLVKNLQLEESSAGENKLFKVDNKIMDDNHFFLDNKGEHSPEHSEDEEMQLVDSDLMSAARSMNSERTGKKRPKGNKGNDSKTHVKFVKYKLEDSSIKEYFSAPRKEGMSSESEVDDPLLDEGMREADE